MSVILIPVVLQGVAVAPTQAIRKRAQLGEPPCRSAASSAMRIAMVKQPRFDAKWQRQRRRSLIWSRLGKGLILIALLVAGLWLMKGPSLDTLIGWGPGEAWSKQDTRFTICAERVTNACVIDGDTVLIGPRGKAQRIRLTGFDAPELEGACEAESLLAIQARDALAVWLNRGPFQLDGGAEPPRDQYGRELRGARRVEAGPAIDREEWLADFMVDAGLARRDRLDRGWCS